MKINFKGIMRDLLQKTICRNVWLLLITTVAISVDAGHIGYYEDHQDYYAYPKYDYKYGVKDKFTGDFKTAHETRDGDITRGEYSILQPDGILRTVRYYVGGKSGFQATVLNSGPGIHGKQIVLG